MCCLQHHLYMTHIKQKYRQIIQFPPLWMVRIERLSKTHTPPLSTVTGTHTLRSIKHQYSSSVHPIHLHGSHTLSPTLKDLLLDVWFSLMLTSKQMHTLTRLFHKHSRLTVLVSAATGVFFTFLVAGTVLKP